MHNYQESIAVNEKDRAKARRGCALNEIAAASVSQAANPELALVKLQKGSQSCCEKLVMKDEMANTLTNIGTAVFQDLG